MIIRPLIAATTVLLFVGWVSAAQTMRVDYYHTGDATQEIFTVDRVVIEPLPWPGHASQALDTSNLGKYLFEVRDAKSKQVLYSRGFASIYGEWETTDEAKSTRRTFQESFRFPAPAVPVEIVLKKRDAKNVF
ncbi:MAG TPA: peptidase M64 N-terminal domain-containing protein, partial [Pyrinomonadaceae bacterium]|nr:peptidase M64 N-terminal domain-containing protein [Pyrinomonadaceae bacterium]